MVLVAAATVVLLASFLAGVVGFAYGLVSLPLLLLLGYPIDQVVAANLIIALVTRGHIVVLHRHDVSWPRTGRMLLGAVPGTLIALAVISVVSREALQLGAGVVTLGAVMLLIGSLPREPRSSTPRSASMVEMLTGGVGGFLGATTSLNGLPVALLYAGRQARPRQTVAELAVYFVGASVIALAVLGAGSQLPLADVAHSLAVWLPVAVIGTWLGDRVMGGLPVDLFRRITFAIIVSAALMVLAQGIAGLV